ncbi:MAG: DNA-binding response regulator [Chloroflexi bacterium CFX4]|nr:DNA-binding response regulator [Chloroflexi bacterium CFX4]MDL1923466.1 response regulator transcription factor [Chloroflexi bacterium CFX3]
METRESVDPKEAHILVVDDEGAIRYSISKTLQRVGYQVSSAASGEEALAMLDETLFDVVLTDIRMPGLSGVELLAKIKERAPDAIVILMTAYASLGTAVEALRLGAHDYLIKPVTNQDIRQSVSRGLERAQNMRRRRALIEAIRNNVRELTEDIHLNQQRASLPPPPSQPIQVPVTTMTIGPLTIFPGRYQIQVGENALNLTPTEFDLLLYLAAHRGRVVPCGELVREVRGYTAEESEAREVIRPHVSNLRRKLERGGQDPDLIVNVRGVGYRLSEPSTNGSSDPTRTDED